jgi:beta-glucanase (GH16 family)
MKAPTLLLLPILCLNAGRASAQSPEVSVTPAVEAAFPTMEGKFFQLERQTGDTWEAVGDPVKGSGQPYRVFLPEAGPKLRVRGLTNQWVRVWADEFEGDRLDPAKWSREENGYGGGNQERQYYSADPKYAQVKDGHLHVSVYREPHTTVDGKTQPYTSARIRSLERGDWTYGRFEVRARVPGGEGIWPAVWMLPSSPRYGGWAASGEIDILESRGSAVHETLGTLHFGGAWPKNRHLGDSYRFPEKNAAEAFHEYAIEWEADEIRWFVDGRKWQTRTSQEWSSDAAPDQPRAPFDQPFHLIINLAVDGGFFNGTDQKAERLPDSAFPQVFQIDYVRVFQWAD